MSSESNQQQTARRVPSLRDKMPRTAKWIDERRAEYGKEWVNDCVRRATRDEAPEADLFYAIEEGHVLGVPFTQEKHPNMFAWQGYAVTAGVKFAAFLAQPPHLAAMPQGEGPTRTLASVSAGETHGKD